MRSIAAQGVLEMGGRGSVLARQKRDHVRLDQLLGRLEEVPGERQGAVLLDIYRLVFPHAFAEEAVLWPVIRRVLPDGEALTLRVEMEHQRINELVARLEGLEPGSAEHGEVLARVVALLREDVRDEEDVLLPRLRARLTDAQLRRIGVAWEVVRAIAPTRAHPVVSRRPPGNVLSALPLAVLDRWRDIVDRRLQDGAGAAAPALRGLGARLGGAARAVERLPGMRRGEDPATRIAVIGIGRGAAAAVLVARRRRRVSSAGGGSGA
jgi:hypothetical protein